MKRTLTIILMVLFIAGIVFAKDSKPKTTYVKPKFKKKTEYNFKSNLKLHLKKEGEDEFTQSYIWDYDLVATDTKSGFLEKAKINLKHLEFYFKGVYQHDRRMETPEESKEFSIEHNLIKNYLREVPDEKTPKVIYKLMIAITYVYLTKEKLEIGAAAEIPKEVLKGLEYTLGFDYKSDLKYKMRVKEEIEKKSPVFGIEKGLVIETALSWRDGDDGIETRALAIYDSKEKLVTGLKAHGWVKHKSLNPENICFTFDLDMKMDPPGNFKIADNPKPASYPKAPENKTGGDTPSSEIPKAFKVGEAAPEFTLKDLNGKDVSLSDFKGKTVLMHMWTTSLDGAENMMTKFYKKINDAFSKDKFVLISLGIPYKKDTSEKQKAFVDKHSIDWVTLWDKDQSISSKYQFKSMWEVALIDKEGKAVKWGNVYQDKSLAQEIDKYLAENCK